MPVGDTEPCVSKRLHYMGPRTDSQRSNSDVAGFFIARRDCYFTAAYILARVDRVNQLYCSTVVYRPCIPVICQGTSHATRHTSRRQTSERVSIAKLPKQWHSARTRTRAQTWNGKDFCSYSCSHSYAQACSSSAQQSSGQAPGCCCPRAPTVFPKQASNACMHRCRLAPSGACPGGKLLSSLESLRSQETWYSPESQNSSESQNPPEPQNSP